MAGAIFIPVPTRRITVASSNLFKLASDYLGDPTKWDQIARLNPQLGDDPFFVGVQTIVIPTTDTPSNGGLIAVI